MSFKDTHISREALQKLSKFYLKNRFDKPVRGFGVVHYSSAPHVHFLMLGTAMDFSSTRVDKKSFKAFKIRLQEFQMAKFPGLTSIVDHRSPPKLKLHLTQQEQHMEKERMVLSDKSVLAKKVKELAKSVTSLGELADMLSKNGIRPYFRNSKLTGVWFKNKKFRLTTLGVGKQHLKELSLEQKRIDDLKNASRGKSRHKGLER